MAGRINNTQSLQQRHKEIYHDLYSRCFLVVSTPVKFFWSGEYGAYIGGPLIGQNLPLRAYVGIEHLKARGKIEIVDVMYNPSRDTFVSQMDQIHRRKLEHYLRDCAEHWYGRTDFQGLRIHSVCELPPQSGFGASGSFASALSVALQLDAGRITTQQIKEWQYGPTYLLPQNRSFDRAMRFSWKASSLLHDGISSGGASFMSFIGSVYPIIYYSEKRAGLMAMPADVRVPLNVGENYDLLDRLFYGGIRLDELFHLHEHPSWPVEFFLVFSGERGGGRSAKTLREIDNVLMEIADTLKDTFEFLKTDPSIFSPAFYQQSLMEGWEGLHVSYLGNNTILSLIVLYALKELFELGGSERSIADLCRALNAVQDSLRILQRTTPTMDSVVHDIQETLESKLRITDVGVKLTGAGRGGDLLVVTPAVETEAELNKVLASLQKTQKENIALDYSSTRDGFEEKGVVIEQYLKEGNYSSFVSQGSVILDMLSPTGRSSITMTMEDFEAKRASFPILCDMTTNDIYLQGRQLNSKELKTAKTTVKILRILADRLSETIGKNDLPTSSYTADRNEMQSKILTPLQKAIRTALRQPLPLSVQGPIRQYTVRLDQPSFELVFLLKRV